MAGIGGVAREMGRAEALPDVKVSNSRNHRTDIQNTTKPQDQLIPAIVRRRARAKVWILKILADRRGVE